MRTCKTFKHRTIEATGYVRKVYAESGHENVSGPFCDDCQAEVCAALRRMGEYSEVGAVPLDYKERLAEAKRGGIKDRIASEIINHPGGPDEIADDLIEVLASICDLLDVVRTKINEEES
jgi:hypothetical protein